MCVQKLQLLGLTVAQPLAASGSARAATSGATAAPAPPRRKVETVSDAEQCASQRSEFAGCLHAFAEELTLKHLELLWFSKTLERLPEQHHGGDVGRQLLVSPMSE